MGLHVAQMTSWQGMRQCFDAVTVNNARILGLQGYGLDLGCRADFVLLQARSPVEAIRLRAPRLLVVRGGQVLVAHPSARRRCSCRPTRRGGLHPATRHPLKGRPWHKGCLARMEFQQGRRLPAHQPHETDRFSHQPLRAQGARRDGREEARLPAGARRPLGQRRRAQVQPAGQGALPGDGRRRGGVRFARHRRIPGHPVARGQADPAVGPRAHRGAHLGSAGRRRARRRCGRAAGATWAGRSAEGAAQPGLDRPPDVARACGAEGHEPGPGRQALVRRHPLHAGRRGRGLRAGLPGLPFCPHRLARRRCPWPIPT
jgi:hypothetical protein